MTLSIRSGLAVLMTVCVIGAIATEHLMLGKYSQVTALSDQYREELLQVKDFEHLQLNAKQLLIMTDLIIGSGQTYLTAGAIDQSTMLARQLRDDDPGQAARAEDRARAETAAATVDKRISPYSRGAASLVAIGSVLETIAATGDLPDQVRLEHYDRHAGELVKSLEAIQAELEARRSHLEQTLSRARETAKQTATLGRSSFLVLVVALWLWAIKRICGPLKRLAAMAMTAKDNYEFKGIDAGPKEALQLSERLVNLTHLLIEQAKHDPLTRLVNRREYERQLSFALNGRRRGDDRSPYCLCYIDLDHFKLVNDTCGHAAGDEVLSRVAHILSSAVRESDVVARLGGDEFAILLRNCRLDRAQEVAEKIRHRVEGIAYQWGEKTLRISASVGVSAIPADADSFEDVMHSVDLACAAAKKAGRNCVRVVENHEDVMLEQRQNMLVVNRVTDALREARVAVYLQEITPLSSCRRAERRFEALGRLLDADGRVLAPSEFLPVVERYGHSVRLDTLMLEEVARLFEKNPAAVANITSVSVNLSGATIGDEAFARRLRTLLAESGLPADKLCLELTETVAIRDQASARDFIHEIRELGVKFALDDFGTGHSTFSYLKSFPADIIKIDGSFVLELRRDEVDRKTVASIVDICRTSGMQTVAEFVEDGETADMLTEMGVDFAQGFHFSRPAPAEDVLADLLGPSRTAVLGVKTAPCAT